MKENRNVYYKARIWVDEEGILHGISVCNQQLPMGLMNELNTKMHEVIDTANGKYEWRRTFYNFIHCGVEYLQYIPENFTPNYSMCKRCCFWNEGGKICNHPHYLDGGKGVCHYPYRKVKEGHNEG